MILSNKYFATGVKAMILNLIEYVDSEYYFFTIVVIRQLFNTHANYKTTKTLGLSRDK